MTAETSPAPAPPPPDAGTIGIESFRALALRVVRIVEAKDHPNADRLYVLSIEGPDGERRQVVAGIKPFYTKEELAGRTAVAVWNLKPARLRGVESQGMLLAATSPDGAVRLVAPDRDLPPGSAVS